MSITNLQFILKDGVLLTYDNNDQEHQILFSAISKYWSYLEDLFEGGTAKVVGNYIIGTGLGASGQTGIVFIWDTEKDKLVHISEGAFAMDASILDNQVYVISETVIFGQRSHFELCRASFGTMNANESEYLDWYFPLNLYNYDGNFDSIKLYGKNHHLYVRVKGKECSINIVEKENNKQ